MAYGFRTKSAKSSALENGAAENKFQQLPAFGPVLRFVREEPAVIRLLCSLENPQRTLDGERLAEGVRLGSNGL